MGISVSLRHYRVSPPLGFSLLSVSFDRCGKQLRSLTPTFSIAVNKSCSITRFLRIRSCSVVSLPGFAKTSHLHINVYSVENAWFLGVTGITRSYGTVERWMTSPSFGLGRVVLLIGKGFENTVKAFIIHGENCHCCFIRCRRATSHPLGLAGSTLDTLIAICWLPLVSSRVVMKMGDDHFAGGSSCRRI